MSTTVMYEGSTIATVNNNTKTLQTAGKYLTDDITLVDVSQSGSAAISITDELDSHGGTIRHINGVDISDSTIAADKVLSGYVGYTANGTRVVGTASAGITPSGTKQISINTNGTTTEDVTSYASVEIAVNVPTGTARTSADLTASGATVTVPAGLYAEQATKSVASGTEGTPVATKGTVSNHAVSVTPSVTNTEGYISGGARAGTAVSVSASELVSGTLTVDSSGTKDVTNYASVSVPAGSATTPATAITSNPSISVDSAGLITATTSASQQVAPTVSAGYVSEGTAGTVTVSGSSTEQLPTLGAQTVTPTKSSQTVQTTGKYMTGDVTVDPIPSQYIVPSGSVTITENGNTDVTDKASVTVAISYATITVSSSAPSGGSDGDVWIQN